MPRAVALCGNCVRVCAAAARQNNAPVSLAGVEAARHDQGKPEKRADGRAARQQFKHLCRTIPNVYQSRSHHFADA